MLTKQQLKKISDWLWEAPTTLRAGMRVPARVYATSAMLDEVLRDRSVEQILNVATLPGIVAAALVMPDVHEGYGFPIGGVAAFDREPGIISPGGIGYDINCGVRLLRSELLEADLTDRAQSLAQALFRNVPSGVGRSGHLRLTDRELDAVLRKGVAWMLAQGHGQPEDANYIESSGRLPQADPTAVSATAKRRGRDQLGTMGAGNHFVEVDVVDEIFHAPAATAFGLRPGQLVVLIHCGSRGLGHQVATDYIRTMLKVAPQYGIKLLDRELACAPFASLEGQQYFGAMAAAANFAWANRQLITDETRRAWQAVFGPSANLSIVYDVAHNIAKLETYDVDGQLRELLVHRKGATRAFPAGHPEVPAVYRPIGQPVLIPGSMGTASYVLVGTSQAMTESFGSSCHGAGRRMSRSQAKREVQPNKLLATLKIQGITVAAGSKAGLAEEAPQAYKDVHDVVEVVQRAGLAHKVARLRPVVVVKG